MKKFKQGIWVSNVSEHVVNLSTKLVRCEFRKINSHLANAYRLPRMVISKAAVALWTPCNIIIPKQPIIITVGKQNTINNKRK